MTTIRVLLRKVCTGKGDRDYRRLRELRVGGEDGGGGVDGDGAAAAGRQKRVGAVRYGPAARGTGVAGDFISTSPVLHPGLHVC